MTDERSAEEYYPDGALKEISHVARDNHVLLQFIVSFASVTANAIPAVWNSAPDMIHVP